MDFKKNQNPCIKDINILYLLCMLLFVGVGAALQYVQIPELGYNEKMLSIVLTQLIFIFLPIVIYFLYKRFDIKKVFRLNKVSFVNILITIAVMAFSIPVASSLNAIVLIILNYFGKLHPQPYFPSENLYQLIINFFVVALTPAIFEELFFRGLVLKSYESIGKIKALLISSLMFALMHRSIQSLVGTFVLGLVIAYIVYRTNSIFAGMIAHFSNNGFAVFITYISLKYQNSNIDYNQDMSEMLKMLDIPTIIAMIMIIAFILAIIFMIFFALLLLLRYSTRNIKRDDLESEIENTSYHSYTPLIISIILVLFVFVMQLL